MLYLDPHRIIENRIAESMGFDKYKMIIEHVRKVDVSADLDFQRTYNGFYRIRRNAEWRAAYYGLFEEIKNSSPTSFSSKMLATVDVNKPIWDRYVASNLCLNLKGKTKDEQLECAIDLYNQMICWYEDFVKTENGMECISEFNKILPDYAWMSDVKKIDFYLWSKREG